MVELLPWNGAVFLIDASNKENFISCNVQKDFKDLRNGNYSVPLQRDKNTQSIIYYHSLAGGA